MNFQTTQAHEELRAKVRAFAEAEVKPIAFMLDKENHFPREAVTKLDEMGLMGIPYDKKYGGAGLDVLSYAIAVEELARVGGGVFHLNVGMLLFPTFEALRGRHIAVRAEWSSRQIGRACP